MDLPINFNESAFPQFPKVEFYSNFPIVWSSIDKLRFEVSPKYFSESPSFKSTLFHEIKKRVDDLFRLPPNWDGQGAVKINNYTYKNVISFLSILDEGILLLIKPEDINITPYGTFEIDWYRNNGMISVEIGTKKIGFFSKFPDNDNPSSDGVLFNSFKIDQALRSAFAKLF